MLSEDSYKTVMSLTQGIYKEKGSRFIALAYPVNSEEEIKEQLTKCRKEYHDAQHHCYAFRLGKDHQVYRVNDDGEPSGSAGKPIYGQILSNDLTNILIVVIRYFGGSKLGIPGLINAYKTATKEALDQATIVVKTINGRIEIGYDYLSMNEVMKTLKEESAAILDQTFDNRCKLTFSIRRNRIDKMITRLQKINGVSIKKEGVFYS
jgi:uncharacterized YigZ family protein